MTAFLPALRFALQNPYSDFYRRKYGTDFALLETKSLRDLPLLTREEVAAAPMYERLFTPKAMVRFVRPTSGSSGRGIMGFPMLEEPELVRFRKEQGFSASGEAGRYFGPYFMKDSPYSLLLFSAVGLVHEAHLHEHDGHRVVIGDYQYPEATVRLSVMQEVDAIFTFPSSLIAMGPLFREAGLSPRIRLIILVGDRMSEFQRTELVHFFPNARIATMYSLTESQGLIGHTCERLLTLSPNHIHPSATFALELIDPQTEAPVEMEEGAEGEVVLTSLVPLAFPLVRYRTGDYALVRQTGPCACGSNAPMVDILGRIASDKVKVPHGGLSVAALEEALGALPCKILEFEALWKENAYPRGLEIVLYTAEEKPDTEALGPLIEARLRVSSTKMYADIAATGEVAPIVVTCRGTEELPPRLKRKRLRVQLG